ncbi:MAG: hypothetical protein IJ206_12090 [Oscillospiraceae bacterium]|nr:hypothetical protein [Oscillospiraceae bacterium]
MEIPVYSGDRICGTLRAVQKGLYTVFDSTVETDQVCRIVAVFEGGELPLGVPAPEQGQMRLHVSVPTSRLPKGRLLRAALRSGSSWERFPGGSLGGNVLPPCYVREHVYRFPWKPGDRLPCDALMCFFRAVHRENCTYLEIKLDPDGAPLE